MLSYFLLIGQSNMAGRGMLDTTSYKPGVYVFEHLTSSWQPARDPLQPPTDPFFSVKADRFSGVGPGMSFAMEMINGLNTDIGLLLCARGGTGIHAWEPKGALFRETVRRANAAQLSATLKGILVYVGEGDTGSEAAAVLWASRFEALCRNLRYQLGEKLPIVFAQLATVTNERRRRRDHGYAWWDTLKALQAATKINNCVMVKTEDLPLNEDGLHLSTSGQRLLGVRFAEAMIRLV